MKSSFRLAEMNLLIKIFNWWAGLAIKNTSRLTYGRRVRVNWFRLRGNAGTISIGDDSILQCRIVFDHPGGKVSIGDRSYIGKSFLACHSSIVIEDDVMISWGVTIVDHNSHSLDWGVRKHDVINALDGVKVWSDVAIAPVKICSKAWVGFGASILKGITVGEGAVIGAGSVVTRDVAPYTLVAGNPAHVIRNLKPLQENSV